MKFKRIFLIVLDSLGVGYTPDAKAYHDEGANTFYHISKHYDLNIPNLESLGVGNIIKLIGVHHVENPKAFYTKMAEASLGQRYDDRTSRIDGSIGRQAF
jgi:phosphopentomutase